MQGVKRIGIENRLMWAVDMKYEIKIPNGTVTKVDYRKIQPNLYCFFEFRI